MRKPKHADEEYSDEEAARRRDEITKALIRMPPQPHSAKKAKYKSDGPIARKTAKRRG